MDFCGLASIPACGGTTHTSLTGKFSVSYDPSMYQGTSSEIVDMQAQHGAAWRSGNKFAYPLPQSVNPDCNRQVESGRKVQTKDVVFCMMLSDVMGCLES